MPTTSHISTYPSNTQYHCTTHISLIHITNFTYAKNNHAQMYAPTASCCSTLRRSRNKRNVGSCWLKSLTGFKRCATTRNNMQQGEQTDATCNIQQCCVRFHGALAPPFISTPKTPLRRYKSQGLMTRNLRHVTRILLYWYFLSIERVS